MNQPSNNEEEKIDVPPEEGLELLIGVQKARQQACRDEGIPAEDARKLVEEWASK